MIIDNEDYLAHYGIIRRSGRYPWGSGDIDNARNITFLDAVADLKSKGMSEVEIARGFGLSTTELRAGKSVAKNQQKQAQIAMAQRLKDKGTSTSAIAKRMGLPESTTRELLKPGAQDKADALTSTANMLKKEVAEKGLLDVGSGVENHLGVTRTHLDTAISVLKTDGYELHPVTTPQLGTVHDTRLKVLCLPGTTQKEVFLNKDKIQQIGSVSSDWGRSFDVIKPPIEMSPNKIGIRYGNEGGNQADGVIYVRPGVDSVSLGGSSYAQVRVAVGKDHYLKGMAMYKDDLPDGVDLLFNTNKSDTGNKLDAMKKNETEDPDNRFGAVIKRQILDKPGKPDAKITSVMNIVNEEGDWGEWSKNLSPQMLSKQSPTLAKTQLDMTFERRQKEYEDILALTNSTVRKKLLEDFAASTDSASVQLKAAALPHQGIHVILPVASMPATQVYAPNYLDGERVVLIRYPHGGTFEIPELRVNNNHREANRLLPGAKDAIGIHPSVAQKLSGADFDGDFVLVIRNNQNRIQTAPTLEGLKNFDPIAAYPKYDGMKIMSNTQTEMGKISNLITDMSLKGAPHSEIVRAVKHSMVVIDAEKHELNFKLSYNDNNIKDLKRKYQSNPEGGQGASTLISRAKARQDVPHRKPRSMQKGGPIDKATGEKVYEETGKISYKTGLPRTQRSTKLAEAKDAFTLVSSPSGTPMERLYADHSNKLKAMANQARLVSVNTPPSKYSASAKKVYETEVASLNSKLTLALKNRPIERQAQLIANANVRLKREYNPNMTQKQRKKIEYQELENARIRTGAKSKAIVITPEEWDAIQAGAISDSKLTQILAKADMDQVRKLATPHDAKLMTSTMTNRANAMLASGYTRAEVAAHLGVSLTTLDTSTVGSEVE
ncbi:MAG: helix-turn-helix domain-containing protein [Paenisporosarcina sp.]